MKQFITTAALAAYALAANDDLSRCLYCRRMSINAGFLESYSYCSQTNECLLDAWNYIDRPCGNSTWVSGSDLYIGDFRDDANGYPLGELVDNTSECEADNIACPAFTSDQSKSGTY